jgi:predicted TIM-barrel fold metal-dependent hydrolase
MISRRQFAASIAAASIAGRLRAQVSSSAPDWGGPVIDVHLHLRRGLDADMIHMQGCGVSNANLLSRHDSAEQVREMEAKYPGRFIWAAGTDVTNPHAADLLRDALKSGATGLGEIKSHVACDSPEMRRIYALAGEMKVPVTLHFQEDSKEPGDGFNTGFPRFGAMLKAYPKTTFIGHGNAFWANLSTDFDGHTAYPSGPIQGGGHTDKWLADYPNLYGDLSANSGNNGLTRDRDFTSPFLERHRSKLMFGSDCACTDGRGGGSNNAPSSRLAGKCVARETLAVLKKSCSPELFRQITWENAQKVFRAPRGFVSSSGR